MSTPSSSPMTLPAALIAVALTAALAAAPAAAQQQAPTAGGPGKHRMADPMRADTNKDGYIDRNEAAQYPRLASSFDAIDSNKDGLLTKAEIDAFIAKKRAEHASGAGKPGAGHAHGRGEGMFARFDTNGDGFIDRTEAANRPRLAQNFDAIDSNRDGRLSKDELRAWRQQQHPRGGPSRPQ